MASKGQSGISQHKRMAMGEKIAMKRGGSVKDEAEKVHNAREEAHEFQKYGTGYRKVKPKK